MFVLPQDINYSPHLSIHEKNLLRCLADHCGSKDICWPSVERIGAYMNVTVRTVQKYLRRIAELKLVEVVRRRGKTNLYRVVCLEERISTPQQESVRPEQTTSCTRKRLTARVIGSWKAPREVKILVEDMTEVLGKKVADRNRGWLWTIAQAVEESWIYEALSWVRQAIQEGQSSGKPVQSPSGLLTWRLRAIGATI